MTLRDLLEERFTEVNAYVDLLVTLDESLRLGPPRLAGSNTDITALQQRMLYSSLYLQLYNLVEATVTRCLEGLAAAIRSEIELRPGQLRDELLRQWVKYHIKPLQELTPTHRLNGAMSMCQHLVSDQPIGFFEIGRGGGGNWDDREIQDISKELGINLRVDPGIYQRVNRPVRDGLGPLSLVKKLRNDLAHGTISFGQCAENTTVQQLVELRDDTFAYLDAVVECFSTFIDAQRFLASRSDS